MAKAAAPTAIAISRNSIWTLQDLQNLPLSSSPKTHINLQAIARQLKIPTRHVPKSELIDKIIEACASYRRTTHTTTPTTEREQLIHTIATSFYQNEGEKLGFYNYLKKCIISGDTVSNLSQEFNRLLVVFRPVLESHLNAKGDYTITTLITYKNDIFKLLKIWLENDFPGHDWMSFFNAYKDAINVGFEDVAVIQKKQIKSSITTRQEIHIKVHCCPAILKAREILSSLKSYDKRRWRDVTWALMLVTGRRQSEVLCTARFETTENKHQLLFSGQLLKHGDDIDPYPIPVLVPASYVKAGMKWLEINGKRDCETPAQVTDKYSKELGEKVRQLIEKYFTVEEGSWTYTNNGKKKNLNTSLFLRHAYAVACARIDGIDPSRDFLAAILGHDESKKKIHVSSDSYKSRVLILDSNTELQQAIFN